MKTPLEIGLVVFTAALVAVPIALIIISGKKSKRADEQDIMAHGRATLGTVIAVDEVSGPRGGHFWKVTVEFTIPDQPDPVRIELTAPEIAWTKTVKRIQALNPGQKVPMHYREQWPTLAVIDDLVT